MKYGLVMVGVVAVCLALMEMTGNNKTFDSKSPLLLIYQFIAPAVVWYLGISARKKAQKGKLTFKQGLVEGFKIALVFGIVSPFVFTAYYLFINPGIVDYVANVYGLKGASTAIVIGVDMAVQFIGALIFGTIYAAIISFFLKNRG